MWRPDRTAPPWWTWARFERAAKFLAGLGWANAEVSRDVVRWEVFAFILAVWAGTEAPRVLRALLGLRDRSPPSSDTSTGSPLP